MTKGKKRSKDEASPGSTSSQPEKRITDEWSSTLPIAMNSQQSVGMVGQVTSPQYMGQFIPPHLQLVNWDATQYSPGTPATPVQQPSLYTVQSSNDQSVLKSIVDKLSNIETCQKNMESKLCKLDKIETDIASIFIRVSSLESKVKSVDDKVTELEASRSYDSQVCDELKKSHDQFENLIKIEKSRNDKLSKDIEVLKSESASMRNDVIDSQARLMRDNLLFFNIPEETTREARISEDCQAKVMNFCTNDLEILDAEVRFKFDRVHRTGQFERGKTRPIVAKFNYYGDKMEVKRRVKDKQSNAQHADVHTVRISDQYPKAIQERRRKLIPYLIQARNAHKQAVLSYDALYSDNQRYTTDRLPPGPVPELPPRQPRNQASGYHNTHRPPSQYRNSASLRTGDQATPPDLSQTAYPAAGPVSADDQNSATVTQAGNQETARENMDSI